jgi:hypothetical protein
MSRNIQVKTVWLPEYIINCGGAWYDRWRILEKLKNRFTLPDYCDDFDNVQG